MRRRLPLLVSAAIAGAVSVSLSAGPRVQPPAGQTTTGQTVTVPKPTVTPLSETLVAGPLTLSTERPVPAFIPGGPACPPPATIRVNSTGGYAPLTWTTSADSRWELVPIDRPPQLINEPATGLVKKPAGPSSRTLRFKAWDGAGWELGSARAAVTVTDGAGNQKTLNVVAHATRACGPPSLTNVSVSSPASMSAADLNGSIQVANFDARDNLEPGLLVESRVECQYPNGTRLACLAAMQLPSTNTTVREKSKTNTFLSRTENCSSAAPCPVRLPNLQGSGTISIRLVNPYGASASMPVAVTFPSRTYTETETFLLPAGIATTGAVVTGTLESAGPYDSTTPGACNGSYLAWRGVTFTDPSGRAKLSRNVKVGDKVSPSSMPQWEIAPGPAQLTMTVTYEVESRRPVCDALVIR